MKQIYLDYCATTPMSDGVKKAMMEAINTDYKNPSSLHRLGLEAERVVEVARKDVGTLMGVEPSHVIFTSGGTEGNNMAIHQGLSGRHSTVAISMMDHPSVLETIRHLEAKGLPLPLKEGIIDVSRLEELGSLDMVIITHVHNELGIIQPMASLCQQIRFFYPRVYIHVDAVQSYGKWVLDPISWDVDSMTVSAHKIHGPKGIGAIYVKSPEKMKPFIIGGHQQKSLRGGTENVLGIIGFGEAARERQGKIGTCLDKAERLKQEFVQVLEASGLDFLVNSPEDGSPYILSLSFPDIRGEVVLHMLEDEGIYVSTGSACSSKGRKNQSPLAYMGLDETVIQGTIRLCFDEDQEVEDMKIAADKLASCVQTYGQMMRG